MLGFEEKLEEIIVAALRASEADVDHEIAAFILVRVVLAVIQGVVVDRPTLNTPKLESELTRLVVGYLNLDLERPRPQAAAGRSRRRSRMLESRTSATPDAITSTKSDTAKKGPIRSR
jgi:hypothetical protein